MPRQNVFLFKRTREDHLALHGHKHLLREEMVFLVGVDHQCFEDWKQMLWIFFFASMPLKMARSTQYSCRPCFRSDETFGCSACPPPPPSLVKSQVKRKMPLPREMLSPYGCHSRTDVAPWRWCKPWPFFLHKNSWNCSSLVLQGLFPNPHPILNRIRKLIATSRYCSEVWDSNMPDIKIPSRRHLLWTNRMDCWIWEPLHACSTLDRCLFSPQLVFSSFSLYSFYLFVLKECNIFSVFHLLLLSLSTFISCLWKWNKSEYVSRKR